MTNPNLPTIDRYLGARRPTVGGGYFRDPDDNLVEFTVYLWARA